MNEKNTGISDEELREIALDGLTETEKNLYRINRGRLPIPKNHVEYNASRGEVRAIPASGGSTAARPSTPTVGYPGRTAPTQRRMLQFATAAGVTVSGGSSTCWMRQATTAAKLMVLQA